MKTSETISNIAKALSKAQFKISGATKNVENKFLKSKYADLQAVWEAIRQPLAENELSIVQLPKNKENEIELETVLMHSSGEVIVSVFSMPLNSKKPQDYGIVLAYLRRYSLSAMVGVYQEDDDGRNSEKEEQKPNYIDEPGATAVLMNVSTLETLGKECKKFKSDYKNGLTGWTVEQWNRICGQMKTNKERLEPKGGDHQEDPEKRNAGF